MKTDKVSVRKVVIQALEEQNPALTGIELSDSQHFDEPPLDLDSLDIVELQLNISARLGIEIGDDVDLNNLKTIGRLVILTTELCEQNQIQAD